MNKLSFNGINNTFNEYYGKHRNVIDAGLIITIIFLLSRAAYFGITIFTAMYSYSDANVDFGLKDVLKHCFSGADGSWFGKIVGQGYEWKPGTIINGGATLAMEFNFKRYSVAHQFLHPLFSWIVMKILHVTPYLSIGIWNNIASYISYILVYRVVYEMTGNQQKSIASVLLFAFHPYNYGMAAGNSEGTFVMFTAIMLLSLFRNNYPAAAIAGGAMNATQGKGIIAPAIIIIDYFVLNKNKVTVKNVAKAAALSVVSMWGYIAKGIYTYVKWGNFFLTEYANKAWDAFGGENSFKNFVDFLTFGGYRRQFYEILGLLLVYAIAAFVLCYLISHRFKLERTDWLCLLTVGAFLASIFLQLAPKNANARMLGRYTLTMFPILPLIMKSRFWNNKNVFEIVCYIFAAEIPTGLLIAGQFVFLEGGPQ
jgi:hypothetical protein